MNDIAIDIVIVIETFQTAWHTWFLFHWLNKNDSHNFWSTLSYIGRTAPAGRWTRECVILKNSGLLPWNSTQLVVSKLSKFVVKDVRIFYMMEPVITNIFKYPETENNAQKLTSSISHSMYFYFAKCTIILIFKIEIRISRKFIFCVFFYMKLLNMFFFVVKHQLLLQEV